jgi:hypothetical protein
MSVYKLHTINDIEELVNAPISEQNLDALHRLADDWQLHLQDVPAKSLLIELLDEFIELYELHDDEQFSDLYCDLVEAGHRYTQACQQALGITTKHQ